MYLTELRELRIGGWSSSASIFFAFLILNVWPKICFTCKPALTTYYLRSFGASLHNILTTTGYNQPLGFYRGNNGPASTLNVFCQ